VSSAWSPKDRNPETNSEYKSTTESDELLKSVANSAPVLVWVSDTHKLCTYFNQRWLDFTGRPLEAELGNGWAEGVHPADLERCLSIYQQAFDRRQEFKMEYRLRRYDGEYRWVFDTGVPRFNADGSFAGYIGSCVDTTDQRQSAEVVRKSDERFRLAAQAGNMFAYEWDAATDVLVRSGECAHVLNVVEAAHVTGQQVLSKIHPDDQEAVKQVLGALTPEKPELRISYRMIHPERGTIWVERTSRAFFDADEKLSGVTGMIVDITERKQVEAALRESEERLRLAVEAGRMYAYEWDVASDVIVRSGKFVDILGLTGAPGIVTCKNMLKTVHPDDHAEVLAVTAACTPENPIGRARYRVIRPDGSVVWLEKTARAFFDGNGKMLRTIGIVADITERKLGEEALSTLSQRLIGAQEAERERIARELHDDIGQRLALLEVDLQQLKQINPGSEEISRCVDELCAQTSEISEDVHDLSHELYSSKLKILGPIAAMRGFCRELSAKQKVEIDFHHDEILRSIPQEISLCLFRILQEALHNAVKHSGVRHFKVEFREVDDTITLDVHDSGLGFDTEAAMRGRGIGLTSMQERLKLVNGELSIESEIEQGTTIRARVPLRPQTYSVRATG
jgi:PAS domain S-box-containing protein